MTAHGQVTMLERVLLVDGTELSRIAITNLLAEHKIKCDYADTLPTDPAQLAEPRYAAVLVASDCLPTADEELTEVLSRLPDLPVVLLHPRNREPGLAAQHPIVFDIIPKPVTDREQALAVVKRALAHGKTLRKMGRMRRELASLRDELSAWEQDADGRHAESVRRFKDENRRLRAVDRMKNNLLSSICHELRSPLVSVRGYTELFYRGHLCPIPDEYLGYFEVCLRNVDKLQGLIESLARHVGIAREFTEIEVEDCDPADVVRAAAVRFREHNRTDEELLELSLPLGEALIETDRQLLENALVCLLETALRHRRDGAVGVTLHLADEQSVKISITVKGPGLSSSEQAELFVTSDDDHFPGKTAGARLTLYQARDCLRLLGSELRFTSQEGRGLTFYFTLPTVV